MKLSSIILIILFSSMLTQHMVIAQEGQVDPTIARYLEARAQEVRQLRETNALELVYRREVSPDGNVVHFEGIGWRMINIDRSPWRLRTRQVRPEEGLQRAYQERDLDSEFPPINSIVLTDFQVRLLMGSDPDAGNEIDIVRLTANTFNFLGIGGETRSECTLIPIALAVSGRVNLQWNEIDQEVQVPELFAKTHVSPAGLLCTTGDTTFLLYSGIGFRVGERGSLDRTDVNAQFEMRWYHPYIQGNISVDHDLFGSFTEVRGQLEGLLLPVGDKYYLGFGVESGLTHLTGSGQFGWYLGGTISIGERPKNTANDEDLDDILENVIDDADE